MKGCYSLRDHLDTQTRTDYLVLLRAAYYDTMDRTFLPTVDELRNQPLEFVEWLNRVNRLLLPDKSLMSLCASMRAGAELHEWVSSYKQVDVATCDMACKAAEIGNVDALKWINEKNPEAIPGVSAIRTRLESRPDDSALLEWALQKVPRLLPDHKRLIDFGCDRHAPELVQKVKDYQTRRVVA
ncbi:hypothetical protein PSACC_01422 [Paramicrosporidium saccamoebae]|uniref:Uncharacterized protein n=1 Tax=Paramicrosporidium saccamoebae TaxID=1246581 RepID=A0A2H9TLZ3_9FUNG|nr:hypothetical protein PSACC_01422 [Paramicrosporidium saccamoebae]